MNLDPIEKSKRAILSFGNLRDYGLLLEPNIDAPALVEVPDDTDVPEELGVPVEEHDPYLVSGTGPPSFQMVISRIISQF